MRTNENSILGISLGTRTLGLAILRGNMLLDWDTKEFKEVWSKQKLKVIVRVIKGCIEKYRIRTLALKSPHPARSSKGLNQLIHAIKKLSETNEIKLFSYSIAELKSHFLQENKKGIVEHIVLKYPEVWMLSARMKTQRNAYHIKVFEAIAVAEMVK